MRDNMTPDVLAAIGAPVITTAILARLDFATETAFLWNGLHPIVPSGSGDSLLDGHQFEPIADGVAVEIGENTFALDGSSELQINIAVPFALNASLAAAQTFPVEYQARPATLWRALMLPATDPLAAPVWVFRRIRSGSIDKLEFQADGTQHNIMVTIESHQGLISNATNQTYLDQKKYDPADTSQDYAASTANADAAPAKGSGITYNSGNKFADGNFNNELSLSAE